MESSAKKDDSILQSVDNALRVIELLANNEEMGITELSRELALGKSTAFRLISTLDNRGFVIQNIKGGKYSLSLKLANIGAAVLKRNSLIKIVHPFLEKLTEKYNETAHLAVLSEYHMTFVDKVASTNAIKMDSEIGARMPAYCTGNGKLLLAYIYKDNIHEYIKNIELKKYTDNTIVNVNSLIKELENIRLMAFSQDNEEKEVGLTCFAAPIRNNLGQVIASISMSGPTTRMNQNKENIIKSIKETADDISRVIGF